MSKKSKNKTELKKNSGLDKHLSKRLGTMDSLLKKLRSMGDKITARQKNAKRRGKRLEKDHRLLKKRVGGVETAAADQLQRIRDLKKKNSTLRERLKRQTGIIKENCARLNHIEPKLTDNLQRSQQLDRQINNLIHLTEQTVGRCDALEQQLATLQPGAGQYADSDQPAGVRADDETAVALSARGLDAAGAEPDDGAAEQWALLEKLQTRMDMLEDSCVSLEEGNRRLTQSLDDLADWERHIDEQNGRLIEQHQALEDGRLDQQSRLEAQGQQIDHLADRVTGLGGQLGELTSGLEENRQWRDQTVGYQRRLEQRLDVLQEKLGKQQSQETRSVDDPGDKVRQLLQAASDREQALRQQVDHLGGLLVTTEGRLTERHAQLALEDARFAQTMQTLEQRLAELEGTLGQQRNQSQELDSLREVTNALQQQLGVTDDSTQMLRQQVEGLDSLLAANGAQLTEQDERQAQQNQQLAQRLDALQQELQQKQSKDLQSLTALTEGLRQQLQDVAQQERSAKQQLDGLESLLETTGGQLAERDTRWSEEAGRLTSAQAVLQARQNRLWGGLVASVLLVLGLGLGGYWLVNQRLAEYRSLSASQVDDLRQQISIREQMLADRAEPAEATMPSGGADTAGAEMTLLKSAFEEQQQRLAILQGESEKENKATQSGLESLRQTVARQKQLISRQHEEAAQFGERLQQLVTARQQDEQLLRELTDEQARQRAAGERLQSELEALKNASGQSPDAAVAGTGETPEKLRDVSWLRQREPGHYAIQLVAAHDKNVLSRVAGAGEWTAELAYYKGQYQGRDWYVLLYGDFPTAQQALSASGELPARIKAFQPWVRRFSWIQRELRN
jgi:septal ring-binding cell division protein DamX